MHHPMGGFRGDKNISPSDRKRPMIRGDLVGVKEARRIV